jgi:hypothetical protein
MVARSFHVKRRPLKVAVPIHCAIPPFLFWPSRLIVEAADDQQASSSRRRARAVGPSSV